MAEMSGNARIAGVMGWPVGQSLSPRLHGYWLRHYGIDGAYVPLAVKPEDLADAVRALPRLGFRGANVTVPHKEAALAAADEADANARRIGAANTLVVEDGRVVASNTDGTGFLENLREGAPDWRPGSGPALVLGAGGAARAIAAALLDAGVPGLRLANRTGERAEALAADLGAIETVPWEEREAALDGAALLVNATSLGMAGAEPLVLDLAALPRDAVVDDIVYKPLETPLLAEARARGNMAVDGIGMLLHQARPGFAAWFGTEPDVTPELRRHVLAGLEDAGR